MLLLYQGQHLRLTKVNLLYIPLCFYYIIVQIKKRIDRVNFTFHYASTISEIPRNSATSSMDFTFHYASTISYVPEIPSASVCLYIPLCFYYIRYALYRARSGISLHSTMLLLYPPTQVDPMKDVMPLHSTMLLLYRSRYYTHTRRRISLHSTMLLLYPRIIQQLFSCTCLYIPLCFYYIEICKQRHIHIFNFTFHYASTISPQQQNNVITINDFTFHYASTISRQYFQTFLYAFYLYIPLCFYYITTWRQTASFLSGTFTFHYASTISGYPGKYSRNYSTFTFHYASTISGMRAGRVLL